MANLEPLGLRSSEDPIENIKTVLDNYDHIGIWLSGGADSALGLYLLQMYNTNTTILPLHGMDIRRWRDGQTKLSEGATEDIIKVIRKRQPEKSHLLHDMYCFDYEKIYYISNKKLRDLHWDIKVNFEDGINNLIDEK